ncbi:mucin-2-like [Helianthus annuus]|uniref:mucin-2-like n=1 Tax=Helianthus annuus TaxID=4232 RepID=UPI000B8EF880|nr:mucin-2-like [Helianthus annuus]
MEARFKDTQADIKTLKAHFMNTTGTAPPSIIFVDKPPPNNAKMAEKMRQLKKKGYEDGLYIAPDNSTMLAHIPLPDGSKKVDVTLNAIADAKARVKKDRQEKDKGSFEPEKRVFMEMNEQGISEPKDLENPQPIRKSTRKVIQPKTTPPKSRKQNPKSSKSSTHQSSKPTDVKTPVVSIIVASSVVSTSVIQTTFTTNTSTHTTSTALSPLPKISSPPPIPPAKRQKTTVDTSSVVIVIVVETPVVSTAVSQTHTITTQTPQTKPSSQNLPPALKQKTIVDTSTVVVTTVVETQVVSTTVSQLPTTFNNPSQAIILFAPKPQIETPPPESVYTGRKNLQVHDDDIPAPDPVSSVPSKITKPESFIPPKLVNPIKDPIALQGYDFADTTQQVPVIHWKSMQ